MGTEEDELAEPVGPRRRPSKLWWLLAAVVFVGGGVAVTRKSSDDLGKLPGKPVADRLVGSAKTFSLGEVREGKPKVNLADYKGKPVVVNFFGSWCSPCLRELPDIQAVSEQYEGRVAFIGITYNDTRPGARSVLKRFGVTYPAGFDPQGTVAYDYALVRMPTTVFISPDGKLLERVNQELTEPQLKRMIDRLFFS